MDMQIELHILVKADVYNYSARVFLIGCLCLKISMSIDYLIDITISYPVLAQYSILLCLNVFLALIIGLI